VKWANLSYEWVKHCVEKYGRAEVEKWYWEVWNEPNIVYWRGTREDFFKLNDYAIDGVRRALPTAKVGGLIPPAGGGFMFLTLRARHQPRHGQDRHAAGLHRVSCQRLAGLH
jgi:xylan 1,4-beta-xylosidase